MTKIVSFSKARKKKDKIKKEARAQENRIKFGRTKSEKKLEKLKNEKAAKTISAHQIDHSGEK